MGFRIILAVWVGSPGWGGSSAIQELRPGKAQVGLGGPGGLQTGPPSQGPPGGSRGPAGSTGAGLRDAEQSRVARSRRELLCRETPVLLGVGGLVWRGDAGGLLAGPRDGVTGTWLWQFPVVAGVSNSLSGGKAPARLWLEFPALEGRPRRSSMGCGASEQG